MILDTPNVIPEDKRDPNFLNRLINERPGVLRKWVVALRRLIDRGRFNEPESSIKAVDEYLKEHDPVGQWLDSRCAAVENRGAMMSAEDLYTDFFEWSKMFGFRMPMTLPMWRKQMRIHGHENVSVTIKVGGEDIVRGVYRLSTISELPGHNKGLRI